LKLEIWVTTCNIQFERVIEQQKVAILDCAKEIIDDYEDRRVSANALGVIELGRRLEMSPGTLQGHKHGDGPLCGSILQAQELFSQVRGRIEYGAIVARCKCCIQAIGPDNINGYTPDCWAEYQERVQLDE
jgi:hypothetical protein